jgi:hypothetical protein
MPIAQYYRDKAAQCRRLANALPRTSDPVARRLRDMAAEFDAKALEAEKAERGRTC